MIIKSKRHPDNKDHIIYKAPRVERSMFYCDPVEVGKIMADMIEISGSTSVRNVVLPIAEAKFEALSTDMFFTGLKGTVLMDEPLISAPYNPYEIQEDIFFPVRNRGSKVETLPGGDDSNWDAGRGAFEDNMAAWKSQFVSFKFLAKELGINIDSILADLESVN